MFNLAELAIFASSAAFCCCRVCECVVEKKPQNPNEIECLHESFPVLTTTIQSAGKEWTELLQNETK